MTGFVLIPGACHGGWWYQPLVNELEQRGHQAWGVTLAGLGPDGMAGAGQVTLESHIAQATDVVVEATKQVDEPIVLVGHSYGGSVITGVADRVPEQVSALVYLDAFVPNDGDSCWFMTNDDQRNWYIQGSGRTGLAVDPLPFFDDQARPHPLATLLQRSRLTGNWQTVATKVYVAALDWPQGISPFDTISRRIAADPTWSHHEWDTRHNVLHDGPGRVLELLLTLV